MVLQSFDKAVNVFLQNVLQGFCKTFKRFFVKVFTRLPQGVYNFVFQVFTMCFYKYSYNVFLKVFTRLLQCVVQGVCKVSAMCVARCLHCFLQGFYKALTGRLQRSHKVFTMFLQGFRNAFTMFLQGV